MINFEVKGAIFDVDDTLLDNKPGLPGKSLHEQSRLAAIHEVGERYDLAALQTVTPEQNLEAFLSASVHTVDAAVWNILMMTGIADSEVLNSEHPLLQEIVALKNHLHKDVLREHGAEVPGASEFVRAFGRAGLRDRMAIASTAVRADVDMFLGMVGLEEYFPSERIKTKESIIHPKPNPEVFNLAFATLGLDDSDRSRVCAFEDDPRGIMSAKAAGLYVCAITTRYSREQLTRLDVAPDLVADSYQEFTEQFALTLQL